VIDNSTLPAYNGGGAILLRSIASERNVMETSTRELVMEELADLPEIGLFEVLDFVRFLKSQWSGMNREERFDRAWMVARRIAAEQGITEEEIAAEVAKVRQKRS
jgi:hypothetical protein